NTLMIDHLYNIVGNRIKGIFIHKGILQAEFGIAMPPQVQEQYIKVLSKLPSLFVPYRGAASGPMYNSHSLGSGFMGMYIITDQYSFFYKCNPNFYNL